MIFREINNLVSYAVQKNLIKEDDKIYSINCLLDILNLENFEEPPIQNMDINLGLTLSAIIHWAVENGIISDSIDEKDLFDTKLMGVLTPKPSEINQMFYTLYNEDPEKATNYFYNLSCNCDYIRRYRIRKDIKWISPSIYGDMDITINLSKPEKDPRSIAAAKNIKQNGYPKCMLCKENVGYRGRLNHPARQTLRAIPVKINNENWFFQYSPYVYYNEHCIVFNGSHVPMKINRDSFKKLLDFVKIFPHYFVGSNADLPIVGGSILTHDHFQGGNYTFAMARAKIEKVVSFVGFEDIDAGIVKWPMSVIRLSGENADKIIELSDKILTAWKDYTDKAAFIYSETDGELHNTITPIARKNGNKFEIDLVLRNNITTEEHPLGVYHPHSELHHIKKENIGLIEVMGLAVLPSRLKKEMAILVNCLATHREFPTEINAHALWGEEIRKKYRDINKTNAAGIIKNEIGIVFTKVLEDSGVYKCTEQGRADFVKFIDSVK